MDGADLNTAVLSHKLSAGDPARWQVMLLEADIAGKTVASQLKSADGELRSVALSQPDTVFAAGSKAYTLKLTAQTKLLFPLGDMSSTLKTEGDLIGSGWCAIVQGQPNFLGIQLNADNTTSLYEVAGTCAFKGLTAFAKGSWRKDALAGGTYYAVTYPDSLKQGMWAAGFATSYTVGLGMINGVFKPAAASAAFQYVREVAQGGEMITRMPHFNAAAVPALRAAAGI